MDSKQDIVTRLRENADLDAMEHCNPIVIAMEREAADEIERLRESLTSLQPAQEPVDYQIREIGEGDWMRVSKERMEAAINDPHIDYRALYTSPFTQTQPNAELESMTRMFHAACADLGQINEALGLDPDDGGAEPILDAIEELKAKAVQSALSADPLKMAVEEFSLTRSIIHECPALRLPQSFVEKLGNVAQVVALKGCDAETAQFIVNACNAARTSFIASDIATALHYPEHWDTAVYPTVLDALGEVIAHFQCTSEEHNASQPSAQQVRREPDLNENEQVPGLTYPTTYADLARISDDALWSRWKNGRSEAAITPREAFFGARAIPSIAAIAQKAVNTERKDDRG
jgi:hypothetical protein